VITGGENNTQIECVLLTDNVTVMTPASENVHMCSELNSQQNICFGFFLFYILMEWRLFVNLFIERFSYFADPMVSGCQPGMQGIVNRPLTEVVTRKTDLVQCRHIVKPSAYLRNLNPEPKFGIPTSHALENVRINCGGFSRLFVFELKPRRGQTERRAKLVMRPTRMAA